MPDNLVATHSMAFPRMNKGDWCSFWEMELVCWMLPLATHCHMSYHITSTHSTYGCEYYFSAETKRHLIIMNKDSWSVIQKDWENEF